MDPQYAVHRLVSVSSQVSAHIFMSPKLAVELLFLSLYLPPHSQCLQDAQLAHIQRSNVLALAERIQVARELVLDVQVLLSRVPYLAPTSTFRTSWQQLLTALTLSHDLGKSGLSYPERAEGNYLGSKHRDVARCCLGFPLLLLPLQYKSVVYPQTSGYLGYCTE